MLVISSNIKLIVDLAYTTCLQCLSVYVLYSDRLKFMYTCNIMLFFTLHCLQFTFERVDFWYEIIN